MWLVVIIDIAAVIVSFFSSGLTHTSRRGFSVPPAAWLRGPGRAMFAAEVPGGDEPFALAARPA